MPVRKIEEICIFGGKNYYPQMSEGHIPTNSAKGYSDGNLYYGKNTRNYEGGSTERFPTNVLKYKCVDNYHRLHPNEKPVALLEYLIKTYTTENDLVLDNVMGSGTTAIACINTNRNYIGFENNSKYYQIATERIENHIKP
jgi:site-specific DNA-methyltransferase (adenine-specific)